MFLKRYPKILHFFILNWYVIPKMKDYLQSVILGFKKYIESGSIPTNLKVKFVEASNRKINLNFSESEALIDLIKDGLADVAGIKFKTISTISSVSGLGINVLFVTKNSEFQKNFLFVK